MILKQFICCCALAAPLSALADDPGMTVVRDPQSGKLRAPTTAELRAMGVVRPRAVEAPHATLRADGSRAITLGERGMVYAVVSRSADGSLARRCVKGALVPQPESRHDQ